MEVINVSTNAQVAINNKIHKVSLISHDANLLAINATIEVMHASELLNAFEQVVTSNLLIQSCIIAELLKNDPDFLKGKESQFSEDYDIEEFYITDEQGIIRYSNRTEIIGVPLPESRFLRILKERDLKLSLASKENAITKRQFKSVAVARRDQAGIIQLGSSYVGSSGQTAINGFGAVTEEAKKLADLINEISTKMLENNENLYSKLSQLNNLARQMNLLGITASIEAAHSTNEKQIFDNLLNFYMVTEAKLSALLLEKSPNLTCDDMVELSDYSGIGEFWITDDKGIVELTNVAGGKGFAFTNEGQTAPYMEILSNPNIIVTAPPSRRALDNRIYKFAAVARRDKKGIFQIGIPSRLYGENTTKGFAEVARQIKNLAGKLKEIIDDMESSLSSFA